MLILEGIKNIDVFGQPVDLKINKKSLHKTTFGGFISITTIIILVFAFYQSIQNYFNKSQLTAQVITEYKDQPEFLQADQNDIMMAITIEQLNFATNPFFNVTLQQKTTQRFENGSIIKESQYIDLVPCDINQFQQIYQKFNKNITSDFHKLQLNSYLCTKQGVNFKLQGTYTSTIFQYLKIEATQCINNSETSLSWKPICASEDEMEQVFQKEGLFKLQVYFVNKIVSPYNPNENFYDIFLDDTNYIGFIPNKLTRESNIYLRKYEVTTDLSITPQTVNEIQSLNLVDNSETSIQVNLGRDTDTSFASFFLRRSPFNVSVERKYYKLYDLLSDLGGFLQISVIVLGFVVKLYNELQLMINVANQQFEFIYNNQEVERIKQNQLKDLYEKTKEKIEQQEGLNFEGRSHRLPLSRISQQRLRSSQDYQNSPTNQNERLISIRSNSIQDNLIENDLSHGNQSQFQNYINKEQQFVNSKYIITCREYFETKLTELLSISKPLELTFYIFMNQIFCGRIFKKRTSVILFKKAEKQIRQQIDINYMLMKFGELDKLKEIILTQSQQHIFNFTPKKQITIFKKEVNLNRSIIERKAKTQMLQNQTSSLLNIQNKTRISKKFMKKQETNYIVYSRLYRAFEQISKHNQDNITQQYLNQQLIQKLGFELQLIYETSKILQFANDSKTSLIKMIPKRIQRKGARHEDDDQIYNYMST